MSWSVKMRLICCPKTAVRNYHCKVHVSYSWWFVICGEKHLKSNFYNVTIFKVWLKFLKTFQCLYNNIPVAELSVRSRFIPRARLFKRNAETRSQRLQLWPREGLSRKSHATPNLSSVLIMCCDVPFAGDVDTYIYECTIVIVNVSNISYIENLFRCYKLFLRHFLKVIICWNSTLKQQTP